VSFRTITRCGNRSVGKVSRAIPLAMKLSTGGALHGLIFQEWRNA
jgi:hypothetical protein